MQIIEGVADADEAGPAFANVAECVIAGLLGAVEARARGDRRAASRADAFAVIAMGKLGGREMTAASDLDLIFVYDAPPDVESTDGAKPLPVIVYYARLAQRLIAALTVPDRAKARSTKSTCGCGPPATKARSRSAWNPSAAITRPKLDLGALALTRARVVAGPAALCGEVEDAIRAALTTNGDRREARRTTRATCARSWRRSFPAAIRWDLKFAPGGLVDIEFIAQTLQLLAQPESTSTPTRSPRCSKLGRPAREVMRTCSSRRFQHA